MKLGLATYDLPRGPTEELGPGILKLPNKKYGKISVINMETGEVIEDIAGLVWGLGKGFAGAIEAPGLFDPEHFEDGKDYAIIAFPCEAMQTFKDPPS